MERFVQKHPTLFAVLAAFGCFLIVENTIVADIREKQLNAQREQLESELEQKDARIAELEAELNTGIIRTATYNWTLEPTPAPTGFDKLIPKLSENIREQDGLDLSAIVESGGHVIITTFCTNNDNPDDGVFSLVQVTITDSYNVLLENYLLSFQSYDDKTT